jgi:FdhD protein
MGTMTTKNPESSPCIELEVRRVRKGSVQVLRDEVAVEEPLEIIVDGDVLATTMRTPGSDRELVLGFLFAEGLIASATGLVHFDAVDENRVAITLESRAASTLGLSRRGTLTTSACGVCGRRGIDDLLDRITANPSAATFSSRVLSELPRRLAARQPTFARTGGLHAAAVADAAGELLVVREDVGRHNAVDKALGALLAQGQLPFPEGSLVVSGRASFEILQKAAAAGLSAVVSVSAPSSLSILIAERARLLLVGFAREDTFNVYAGHERLREWSKRSRS